MSEFEKRVAANPIQETIARVLFERRSNRKWDEVKRHDQWLALGYWDDAGAVLELLPVTVSVSAP